MNIISQVKFNTTADKKGYRGEITVTHEDGTKEYPALTGEALVALLTAHKAASGTIRGFSRTVTIKKEAAAKALGKKVGDTVTIVDYVTDPMSFTADVGGGYADNVGDIKVLSTVAKVKKIDIDLDEVDVVESKPRQKAVTTVLPDDPV